VTVTKTHALHYAALGEAGGGLASKVLVPGTRLQHSDAPLGPVQRVREEARGSGGVGEGGRGRGVRLARAVLVPGARLQRSDAPLGPVQAVGQAGAGSHRVLHALPQLPHVLLGTCAVQPRMPPAGRWVGRSKRILGSKDKGFRVEGVGLRV